MYDAWAAYDAVADPTRPGGPPRQTPTDRTEANKAKAVSFAAYRSLVDLFPTQKTGLFDPLMADLGYDPADTTGRPASETPPPTPSSPSATPTGPTNSATIPRGRPAWPIRTTPAISP